MSDPLVSIVVPCFNAARFLDAALDSCMAQTYGRCEVIAVDDGSTDPTPAILARYAESHPDVLQVFARAHGGVSAARNFGMEVARGDYLLFLDADDVLEPRAIERLVRTATGDGTHAVGDWRNFWHETDRQERVSGEPHYADDGYASCVRGLFVLSAVLVRRCSVRWNERRAVWEGLEFVLDCMRAIPRLAYVGDVVVNVRQHDTPERTSVRLDHFEPMATGRVFAEQKATLARSGELTSAREEALDERIVSNACALVRTGRMSEARDLLATVSWKRVGGYDWYRRPSFAGAVHLLGVRAGTAAFYYVNRALGRL